MWIMWNTVLYERDVNYVITEVYEGDMIMWSTENKCTWYVLQDWKVKSVIEKTEKDDMNERRERHEYVMNDMNERKDRWYDYMIWNRWMNMRRVTWLIR